MKSTWLVGLEAWCRCPYCKALNEHSGKLENFKELTYDCSTLADLEFEEITCWNCEEVFKLL